MKLVKNGIKKIFYLILILSVIIILYKAFSKIILKEQLPTIFGYGSATVITGSMQPNLNVGDYIIIKEEKDYYKDDIVIYIDSDNYMVTHRIIEKDDQKFITKGDNNNIADKPIKKTQIKGKVVLVLHGVGMIQLLLLKPISLVIISCLISIMLVVCFRKKDDKGEIDN